jgi:hypothetical protein
LQCIAFFGVSGKIYNITKFLNDFKIWNQKSNAKNLIFSWKLGKRLSIDETSHLMVNSILFELNKAAKGKRNYSSYNPGTKVRLLTLSLKKIPSLKFEICYWNNPWYGSNMGLIFKNVFLTSRSKIDYSLQF